MNPNPYAPPQQAPRMSPSAPSSSTPGGYFSPVLLGWLAWLAIAASIGLLGLMNLVDLVMAPVVAGGEIPSWLVPAERFFIAISTLVRWGGGIVFLIWLHRVATNARVLGRPGLTTSPGMCVSWYFIPFANFVMPDRVMSELAVACDPRGSGSVPAFVHAWWALYIFSLFASILRKAVTGHGYMAALASDAVITAIQATAAIALLIVIRTLSRWQEELRAQSTSLQGSQPQASSW